ncbi:MAG: hypothetical protein KatS3mg108_0540 [Isosphaeraceae bacterium]|jgi:hypothetical protein|nr:MAG: hypothetical protein KatS3mg108_0540 [Isosphaeraceae bacterium]
MAPGKKLSGLITEQWDRAFDLWRSVGDAKEVGVVSRYDRD